MAQNRLQAAYDAAGQACLDHGVVTSPGILGASIVDALLGLGMTPPAAVGGATDLERLIALHAATTQRTWSIMPNIHEDTRIVEEGRGLFGLIAEVSTSTPDYGRANAAFIVAAHRAVPGMAAELAAARKKLAA